MQDDEQPDIVERLRKAHQMQEGRGSNLYEQAANEIEYLRTSVTLDHSDYHAHRMRAVHLKPGTVLGIDMPVDI